MHKIFLQHTTFTRSNIIFKFHSWITIHDCIKSTNLEKLTSYNIYLVCFFFFSQLISDFNSNVVNGQWQEEKCWTGFKHRWNEGVFRYFRFFFYICIIVDVPQNWYTYFENFNNNESQVTSEWRILWELLHLFYTLNCSINTKILVLRPKRLYRSTLNTGISSKS